MTAAPPPARSNTSRRRTFAQVAAEAAADAVSAERAAMAAHIERQCGEIEGLIGKQRMSAEEGSTLKRRLREFARGIAQGLHVDG
ncbi:hypothetical protein [Allosphingosinicella indica]|uniref:Uncharacterized protein n=1 Tax=Allosphingosinicella indica TaxID=941907 RepID=A0A1X7GJG4_9SPHN|nr:hypothetical protein [Allosphingosinicella indica]SMF70629.1 hypothetical protein SAMN06295910_1913 [Allosphingosinicella indica]